MRVSIVKNEKQNTVNEPHSFILRSYEIEAAVEMCV